MKFSTLLTVASLAFGARAQDDDDSSATPTPSASGSASATASESATTHTVAVGANGHNFRDNNITAAVGDVVEFLFYPANHSVIRAEFGNPCVPYELSDTGRVGFDSGFHPVKAFTNDGPKFQITINDTQPIFYYCGADESCWKNHMIGAINQNETQSLEEHMEAAEGLTFQVLPGEEYPEEGSGSKDDDEDKDDDSSTGSSSDESNSNGNNNDDSGSSSGGSSSSLGGGEIAGIVIGGVAVLIIGAALIYFCGRRGGIDTANRRDTMNGPPPTVSEANYVMGPKSPGATSRFSSAHWSMKPPSAYGQEGYQGHPAHASMGGSPQYAYAVPGQQGVETHYTGHSQGAYSHDPRMSSPPPAHSPGMQSPVPPPVELSSETGPAQGRYTELPQQDDIRG